MSPRVLVVGSANMDLSVRCAGFPAPGETVMGDDLVRTPGGKGFNQAVAVARLGGDASLIGQVGDDAFGHELLGHLDAEGVTRSSVVTSGAAPTGVALITVDHEGENKIVVAPGANRRLEPSAVAAAWRAAPDVVLAQLEVPVETVMEAARIADEAGVPFVLNAAPVMETRRLADGAPRLVHTVIANEIEAKTLSIRGSDRDPRSTDDLIAGMHAFGFERVIVTLGAEGALFSGPEWRGVVASICVDAIDTVGAGDAFCGAYAVALAEGRSPEESLRFACVAGALATTGSGAAASLPSREQVESKLAAT